MSSLESPYDNYLCSQRMVRKCLLGALEMSYFCLYREGVRDLCDVLEHLKEKSERGRERQKSGAK